jgi:phosphate starvation-inducible PhoH-like protein
MRHRRSTRDSGRNCTSSRLPDRRGHASVDPRTRSRQGRPSRPSVLEEIAGIVAPVPRSIPVPDQGVDVLFGAYDDNLRLLEELFGVSVRTSGHELVVDGAAERLDRVEAFVGQFGALLRDGYRFARGEVKDAMRLAAQHPDLDLRDHFLKGSVRASAKRQVVPKTPTQRTYLEAIDKHDIVFGVGPAGTGKTYLAMAQAVASLLAKKVSRIVLTRPAVEAGEKLGFLPGDLQEKVNPYLRPLYDALYDMLEADKVERLLERGTIEVAPLAFMRGRTLNDAFVILDEAQNTTSEQMKMFLTRLGFGSKAVVTGDITQIDLPYGRPSGLIDAIRILGKVEGLAFVHFTDRDVVRHKLVQLIVQAYAAQEAGAAGTVGTPRA